MSLARQTQMAAVRAAEHRRLLAELGELATDVDRCERTIAETMEELNAVNAKYQGPRNTRQDVEYLTVLLECAKKKLAWEKKIASLQKRAPALLEAMTRILNDQDFPPTPEIRVEMLKSLQMVQAALTRLHGQPIQTEESHAPEGNGGGGGS
jgi:hypothetical protein